MFMTVALQGDVTPALLVPEAAIVPEQGRTFVFVVAGRRRAAARSDARQAPARRSREIVDGLKEQERVIVEGTQNVRDGSARRRESCGARDRRPDATREFLIMRISEISVRGRFSRPSSACC